MTEVPSSPEPSDPLPPPSRLGWWAAAAVVVGIALFWVYVFFFADQTPPDRLSSDAFPKAAEQVCAATRQAFKDVGIWNVKASSLEQRAALTEQADTMLAKMVGDLRALPQPAGDDAEGVKAWLSDWDLYLSDRAKWVANLRAGIDQEFLETARASGEPNSKAIDAFAIVNYMESCQIPDNV